MLVGSFFLWVMNRDIVVQLKSAVHPSSIGGNMAENGLLNTSNYCYQQVLPPVRDSCHLQKSVVIVKCLPPATEFKELLGSLVQMPFTWVK